MVDITNKFVVAECYDGDTTFIEAAPFTWFKDNRLYWPSSQKNLRLRCHLMTQVDLSDANEWKPCDIKTIKGLFDSYQDACATAATLVEFSDTEEEERSQVQLSKSRTAVRQKPQGSETAHVNELNALMASVADPVNEVGATNATESDINQTFEVTEDTIIEHNEQRTEYIDVPVFETNTNIMLPSDSEFSQYLSANNENSTCKLNNFCTSFNYHLSTTFFN